MLAHTAPPRIGAVVNVGSAHLGEFGSVETIAKAKAELVQALPAAADGGVAILNADDPLVAAMADLTTAAVVTVGRDPGAVIRAEDVTQDDADHAGFTLVTPEGSAAVALKVVGAHQVGNALTAAAVGRAVGMSVADIAAGLSSATASSKWRMQVTELAGGITLINDAYNANPHSMKAALRSLSTIGRGRRSWAVLGEMAELGPATNSAHDEIGRLVVRLGIERLIVVQGPGGATGQAVGGRTGARALHLGAHLEGSWGGESELVPAVEDAVDILEAELAEGDVVLVKGSRSAGLERVALRLIADLGTADTAATDGETRRPAEWQPVKTILVAAVVALAVSILFTPYLIKVFSKQGFGQEIREDGPEHHKKKRGTPTMGGAAIIIAMWVGFLVADGIEWITGGGGPTASAPAAAVSDHRDGPGRLPGRLHQDPQAAQPRAEQADEVPRPDLRGVDLRGRRAVLPQFRRPHPGLDIAVLHQGSGLLSRSAPIGFVVLAWLLVAAWSNAVNFTDGLDGLAAGSSVMVLGTYVAIGFFQFRNACWGELSPAAIPGCYDVRDPLDLAVVAAAALGGCIGFLWWNAHPARIMMGDTGSLALGGLIAGLSILTKTELLLVVIAGLFVVEMLSVVIQIAVFKTRHVRVFKMAPFHHHFELSGWAETTVMVRFWLLAAMSAALGLGLFYAEWLSLTGG